MLKADNRSLVLNLLRAALPALLAAGFCFFNVVLPAGPGPSGLDTTRLESGSCLLSGLPSDNVAWLMPLFKTLAAAAVSSGVGLGPFLAGVHLALYALVFCAGCLLRGYWAGVLALAGAGALEAAGFIPYDGEQAFYSFSLLLVFTLLLLRDRDSTLKSSVLAGLAIGASLLVRTPLLLLPPALALLDWLGRRGRPRWALGTLALLAASYALLLPWGLLNSSVSGRFSLAEGSRADSNLITSAMGSVYTMEGDPGSLAGLEPGDSALAFYAQEAARQPLFFAANVLKRLWHIFLLSPPLFGLFLLALALGHGPGWRRAFLLPLYFIFVHSLLSIEPRYFYPLQHLLPPLIAAGLLSLRGFRENSRPCPAAEGLVRAAFLAVLGAVLVVEALVAAYPYRSAGNMESPERLAAALARFPGDRLARDLKCQLLLSEAAPEVYYRCLADNSRDFGDRTAAYFLAAGESRSPSGLPVPAGLELEGFTIRMLRELELGDTAAAEVSFRLASAQYGRWHNMFRGEPYRRDRELAARLKGAPGLFWEEYVLRFFFMLPPERALKTLRELEKRAGSGPLPGRRVAAETLEKLKQGLAGGPSGSPVDEALALGEPGERMLRQRLARSALRLPPARRHLLWREASARSKEFSDLAVEEMKAGDLAAAEGLLLKSVDADPANPEAFMNLCTLWQRRQKTEKAIGACRGAASAAHFGEKKGLEARGILASEALFRSYKLLLGAGRKAEAEAALRRAVENAPAAWPGLPAALAAEKQR